MLEKLISVYVFLFARRRFLKFNKLLYRLSLGGLGVLNYKTFDTSGERKFLKNYLNKKRGVVIDVGANEGDYTKEAIHINDAMKFYAFEPHPKTFLRLSNNLAGHRCVSLLNKGLSSTSGTLKLYDYASNDGSSHASLFERVITQIHGSGSSVAHEINVTTIDEFMESEKIQEITLLKIDAEGNELEVLRGSANALLAGKIKAVHFEFNEMNIVSRSFFYDFWAILDRYDLYRLLPNEMLKLKNYSPLDCEIFSYQNIVAILRGE